MPLLPGFKVLEWVRAHPAFRALPVIVFTSSVKDDDKAQAKALNATDYIERPFAMSKCAEIVLHLEQAWNLDGAGANTAASPPQPVRNCASDSRSSASRVRLNFPPPIILVA